MARMWRQTGAVLVAAVLVIACAGDGNGGPDASAFTLITPGTLTVCTDVPYPPFAMEDPDAHSGYSGFDIELMEAVASQLGLALAVVDTDFEGLESGETLNAGSCDIAASAMMITESRAQRVRFSDVYYVAMQSLLVAQDAAIASLEDLGDNDSVGVQSGTTGEIFAEEAVTGASVVVFENPGALFVALEANEITAIIQDLPVNQSYARDRGSVVVAEYDTGEEYGFAVAHNRSDGLIDAVNSALEEIRSSGHYDALYEQYFLAR